MNPHLDVFFAFMQASGIATVLTDPTRQDNPIIFANGAFSDLTGFAIDEIVGRNCRFLQAPDANPATIRALRESIAARHLVTVEILNRKRDGGLFWNALCLGPVFDADGKLCYFIGSQIDITPRRNVEQALHQLQKVEAIGHLTAGVAHDFNNLLTVILTSVAALRRDTLTSAKRSRYIEAIESTADRAAKLTGQLLAFARKQPMEPTVFDASDQVRRMVDMLQTILGSRIEIVTDLSTDQCLIKGDASQFETALVNIAVNGRDAMRGQGSLAITVKRVAGPSSLPAQPEAEGDVITVVVSDTGEGIPSDRLEQIFEPFYTTRDAGSGTGLGLSQVFSFAKEAGGSVHVESELDRGTTFVLSLPCAVAEPIAKSPPRIDAGTGGRGRLLMIEHHIQIAEITSEILIDLGYEVRCVINAAEAMAAIEAAAERFDLVFSDVLMPGPINGIALARELHRRWPALPILLTTGYSNVLAKHDNTSADFEVLRKPYSAEALTNRIAHMIRASEQAASVD